MPIRSNPLATFNQSQSIADAISNVGSIFNPANTMQMGLLQAKQREIDANIANQTREIDAKIPMIGSETTKNLSTADAERARGANYNAQTKLSLQQFDARNNAASVLAGAGVPTPQAAVLGNFAQASGPNTGSEDFTKSYLQITRPEPVKIGAGETIQYAVGPNGERLDPRDARNTQGGADQPPQIRVPEMSIPYAQGGMGGPAIPPPFSPQPQAVAPAAAPAQLGSLLTSPRQTPNIVSNGNGSYTAPMKPQNSGAILTDVGAANDKIMAAQGILRDANSINDPDKLANAKLMPLIGGVQAKVESYLEDPKSADATTTRNTFNRLRTSEWLKNGSLLKGAQSDKEGEALWKGIPEDTSSTAVRKDWLDRVGYHAKIQIDYNNANAQSLKTTGQPLDPVAWEQAYTQGNPPPGNSLYAKTGAASGAGATDPHIGKKFRDPKTGVVKTYKGTDASGNPILE